MFVTPVRLSVRLLLSLIALTISCAALGQTSGTGIPVDYVGESETRTVSVQIAEAAGAKADLLRSERTGQDFHVVLLNMPRDQTISVELGFAELDDLQPGQRVFNVYVNDRQALTNFDIVEKAGGSNRAVTRRFTITPRRGFLDVQFQAIRGEAKMGYIRVSGRGFEHTVSALAAAQAEEVEATDRAEITSDTGELLVDGARRAWPSAVPFGTFGTGKFEILANGEFANFTLNNSWDSPLPSTDGTFLAIAAKASSGGGMARMLRINDPGSRVKEYSGVRNVSSATYKGRYPFAEWSFTDEKLPFQVRVKGFSPMVPHGEDDLSLPVAYLLVEVKNPRSFPIQAAVALSWEDLNGRGGSSLRGDQFGTAEGLVHTDASSSGVAGILMSSNEPLRGRRATFLGDTFIGIETTMPMVITRSLHWDPSASSIPWWKRFATRGRLDRRPSEAAEVTPPTRGTGSSAAVVCATIHLAPKEVRQIPFIVSWNYPRVVTVPTGTAPEQLLVQDYGEHFASSLGVAAYAAENRPRLFAETTEWHSLVEQSNLPDWLKLHVLNSAFPAASNSIRLGGGLFSLLESPVDLRGMLGGVDYRLASNAFLASLFPSLERTELELFSRAQDPSGRIPRYVGNIHGGYTDIDPRLLGTQWSDGTAAWILQVASHYRATGNENFLKRVWPSVERAVAFLYPSDPAQSAGVAPGTVLDTVSPAGSASTYGHILSAAALRAALTLAETQGAADRADAWRPLLQTAEENAVRLAASLSDPATTATNAAALAGDWALRTAGLPPLLPDDAAAGALRTLIARHVEPFHEPAIPLEAPAPPAPLPEKALSLPALVEPYLGAAALRLGLPDPGIEVFSRSYNVLYNTSRNAWHQALRYQAPEGTRPSIRLHRGATAAWNALSALAGFSVDVPGERLLLDPNLPASFEGHLHLPLFSPRFWAWLEYDGNASTGTLHVIRTFDTEETSAPVRISRVARRIAHGGAAVGETVLSEPLELVEDAAFDLDFRNGALAISLILPPEPEVTTETLLTTGTAGLPEGFTTAPLGIEGFTTEPLGLDSQTTATDAQTTVPGEEPFNPEPDLNAPIPMSSTTETTALEEEHESSRQSPEPEPEETQPQPEDPALEQNGETERGAAPTPPPAAPLRRR